jgi:iron complex outermembrane receptor protein
MKNSTIFKPIFLISAMLACTFAGAQDTADNATQTSTGLEEILVTATRRETNLQTTPISVSVIGSELIEYSSPRDIGDLSVYAPNFSAARVTSFANAASFALRGVGQNNIIVYFESPVAVLVDDFVMMSVQTQLLDTFDIEQLEVLRGPQGTLFGKNTTGGAISVRTKRPLLDRAGGAVEGGLGSYGSQWLKAAVDIPLITDQLALRVVGSFENSDGYVRNGAKYGPISGFAPNKFNGLVGAGGGERTGGLDVFNGRIKVLWQPTEKFSALFQYEAVRDDTEFEATINDTPIGAGFVFDLVGLGQTPGGDPLDKGGTTNRGDLLIDLPEASVDVDGFYLNMDLDVGVGTLSSVLGYRSQDSRLAGSETGNAPTIAPDGEVLSPFDINRSDDRETLQAEVRFASAYEGPLNFIAGAFYQEEDIDFCVAQVLGFLDLLGAPIAGFSYFGVDYGTFNQNPYILCSAQESDSTAVFTEGTYEISDKLTLTGGFRYTWESKTFLARQQIFVQELGGSSNPAFTWPSLGQALGASVYNFPFGVVRHDSSPSEPTWRVSLGYQATDDIYAYATYSRGFKSGGYNDQIGNSGAFGNDLAAFQIAVAPTEPETADSYEIGIKSEALDGRLRLNITGFYVQYDDLQRQINIPLIVNGVQQQITQFFNAAKADVKGIEAEATMLATDNITLRAVFGYQDCSIKDFFAPGAGYDLTTAPCERAPEFQWTLDGTYQAAISDKLKIAVNAHVNFTDENLYTQSIQSPDFNTFLDDRTLWNASITISDRDDKYFARLIGKNLSDERYKVATQVVAGLWTFANYGPPRFYAAEVGVRW